MKTLIMIYTGKAKDFKIKNIIVKSEVKKDAKK